MLTAAGEIKTGATNEGAPAYGAGEMYVRRYLSWE